MKMLIRLLCLAAVLSPALFAGGFGVRGGFGHGFGGHRGFVGVKPGFHGFGAFGPGFNRFGFGFGGGFIKPVPFGFRGPVFVKPAPFGFRSPFLHRGFGFGRPFGYPFGGFYGTRLYPYPAYGITPGLYDGYAGTYPYSPAPNVVVIYPPAEGTDYYSGESSAPAAAATQGSPSVVINEYRWGSSSNVATPSKPLHFSIALRDNSVIDAAAYWVEGNELHYVDAQGKRSQVPLSEVDRTRSRELNSERGIEFGLPNSR
jgi:hypothetical protein